MEEQSSHLVPSQGLCTQMQKSLWTPPVPASYSQFVPACPQAQVWYSLPFKNYFSTCRLPIAGESNELLLTFCLHCVCILIPDRSILLRSQRTHYPFLTVHNPSHNVCPQEEMFAMQGMTQTRSKQRYKECGEK